MNDKLKQIIFNKLYDDLKHVKIISFNSAIWFIDIEKKYWYLEFNMVGELWYRGEFFSSFFSIFSIESNEYQWIITEWMEETLKCKVTTPKRLQVELTDWIEELLNSKIIRPKSLPGESIWIDLILNDNSEIIL